MLPKKKRFTKEDFSTTRPNFFFRGELFDIALLPLTGEQRFACVIAKKTLKKAVDRNYLKRKVFSICETIHITKPYSFIVYPKQKAATVSYRELTLCLQEAFRQLH